jgi:hypothetical protein
MTVSELARNARFQETTSGSRKPTADKTNVSRASRSSSVNVIPSRCAHGPRAAGQA